MFLRNPAADGIVILLIVLLFFGPKRILQLTRSVGESIKELKGGLNGTGSRGSSSTEGESIQQHRP